MRPAAPRPSGAAPEPRVAQPARLWQPGEQQAGWATPPVPPGLRRPASRAEAALGRGSRSLGQPELRGPEGLRAAPRPALPARIPVAPRARGAEAAVELVGRDRVPPPLLQAQGPAWEPASVPGPVQWRRSAWAEPGVSELGPRPRVAQWARPPGYRLGPSPVPRMRHAGPRRQLNIRRTGPAPRSPGPWPDRPGTACCSWDRRRSSEHPHRWSRAAGPGRRSASAPCRRSTTNTDPGSVFA
jgi:hypothetical protein